GRSRRIRRERYARGRVVRRGLDVPGRGGRALCATTDSADAGGRVFRHGRSGVPRQDQRHRAPRRARSAGLRGGVRHARLGAVGGRGAGLDARGPALAVVADIRTGLAGGGDERDGGDAAAAFLFGDGEVVAEPLGQASRSAEFLDRWRVPGDTASRQWEERFGEHVYVPLGEAALAEALKQAGVTAAAVDVLIVAGPHTRSNKRVAASAGVKKEAIADDLAASVGNTGAAHAGLMLAGALDVAP